MAQQENAAIYGTRNQLAAPGVPPRLHWVWVLLFAIFTGGLFGYIWLFIQAKWIRHVRGSSLVYGWAVVCVILSSILIANDVVTLLERHTLNARSGYGAGLLYGIYVVIIFVLQQQIEETLPGTRLSGVMTFFFGPVYFQYHLRRVSLAGTASAPTSAAVST